MKPAEFSIPSGAVSCAGDPFAALTQEDKTPLTAAVRYGYMKLLGQFIYKHGLNLVCGSRVIVETDRGVEIGEHVGLTCSGCSHSIPSDKMLKYAQESGEGYLDLNCGKILRMATGDDLNEERHIRQNAADKLRRCKELIKKHNLPMKLVDCEHLFGGERIIFYFLSETRVDFRDLVKDLAKEYHTRIEMRQIGARDEARLLADYETCGQECCCRAFLKSLKPISMKMAKIQKATLDPTKVSGRCGRLKCCLRYEHETYEELEQKMPDIGQKVRGAFGDGVVVDRHILTQLVQVETEDRRRVIIGIEDITTQSPIKNTDQPADDRDDTPPPPVDDEATTISEAPGSKQPPDETEDNAPGTTAAAEKQQASRGKRRRKRRSRKHKPSSPSSESGKTE